MMEGKHVFDFKADFKIQLIPEVNAKLTTFIIFIKGKQEHIKFLSEHMSIVTNSNNKQTCF